MGPEVEEAIARCGADRGAVVRHIWECGCRNRQRRYYEVAQWAEKWLKAGEWGAAMVELEGMLARGLEEVRRRKGG